MLRIKVKLLCAMMIAVMLMTMASGAFAQENDFSYAETVAPETQTSGGLTSEQENAIFDDIQKQILSKYEGIYTFDNFTIEFVNQRVDPEQEKVSVDVNVDVDMTLIRHPADSPYVKGMQSALTNISSKNETVIAQDAIQAFLQEVTPYYKEPSRSAFLYRVEFYNSNADYVDYQLFYREDITLDETILTPVEAPNTKLDESSAEENGRQAIHQAITEGGNMTLAVSYNRIAARDYALKHAFDVPEFSAANGMGSDCANFVSKALNAGGIPVDKAGNWYPSPSKGSYAGTNWMRTGYYNNGGVVPYMVNKGYFAKQTNKSLVSAGSILNRTDTSHVALVTYGDGTTIKYTEHSDYPVTKKDIVYSGSNATFYTYK